MRHFPFLVGWSFLFGGVVAQDKPSLHTFERMQRTNEYYSEGANAGDLNNDGHVDAVYGPHWYDGPAFATKHEIYPPKPQHDWESHYVTSGSILRMPDGSWRMWYASRTKPPFNHKYFAIGSATWEGNSP